MMNESVICIYIVAIIKTMFSGLRCSFQNYFLIF